MPDEEKFTEPATESEGLKKGQEQPSLDEERGVETPIPPEDETAAPVSPVTQEPPAETPTFAPPVSKEPEEPPPAPEAKEEAEEEKKVSFELVETIGKPGSIKEYKVIVPWEEYDNRLTKLLKEIRKTTVIDGFRKGKAPLRLIKIRYRKQTKQEILDEIFPIVANELLEKDELSKITNPVLVDSKVEEGQPVGVVINVEVLPKLEPGRVDYTGIAVSIKKQKVTDELIEKQIKELQRRNATFEPKEGGSFEKDDGAVINLEVEDERGQEIKNLHLRNYLFERPDEDLPPEIYKELPGKEKGAKFEVEIPNERKNPRGEVMSTKDRWKVEVLEIKKCVLPQMDDEFAKDLGEFENLKELTARIRENLEKMVDAQARDAALEAIYKKLIDKVPFEPPVSYVDEHKRRFIKRDIDRLYTFGIEFVKKGETKEEYVARKQKDAGKTVKISLILDAIARMEKLEVSDEDYEAEVARIAEREGRKPLAIKAKMEAEGRVDSFRDSLLTKKVEDFLLENNNITYEEVEQLS